MGMGGVWGCRLRGRSLLARSALFRHAEEAFLELLEGKLTPSLHEARAKLTELPTAEGASPGMQANDRYLIGLAAWCCRPHFTFFCFFVSRFFFVFFRRFSGSGKVGEGLGESGNLFFMPRNRFFIIKSSSGKSKTSSFYTIGKRS